MKNHYNSDKVARREYCIEYFNNQNQSRTQSAGLLTLLWNWFVSLFQKDDNNDMSNVDCETHGGNWHEEPWFCPYYYDYCWWPNVRVACAYSCQVWDELN